MQCHISQNVPELILCGLLLLVWLLWTIHGRWQLDAYDCPVIVICHGRERTHRQEMIRVATLYRYFLWVYPCTANCTDRYSFLFAGWKAKWLHADLITVFSLEDYKSNARGSCIFSLQKLVKGSRVAMTAFNLSWLVLVKDLKATSGVHSHGTNICMIESHILTTTPSCTEAWSWR